MALLKNDIEGPIPTEFGLLTNMTRLDLQEMSLSGSLPSELGSMSLLSKSRYVDETEDCLSILACSQR
jgi:hypothetical protein